MMLAPLECSEENALARAAAAQRPARLMCQASSAKFSAVQMRATGADVMVAASDATCIFSEVSIQCFYSVNTLGR